MSFFKSCFVIFMCKIVTTSIYIYIYGISFTIRDRQNCNLWIRVICCFYIKILVQSPIVFINYKFMNTIWERCVMMSEVKRHVLSQLVRPLLHVQFLDVRLINDMSMTSICIIMIKLKNDTLGSSHGILLWFVMFLLQYGNVGCWISVTWCH